MNTKDVKIICGKVISLKTKKKKQTNNQKEELATIQEKPMLMKGNIQKTNGYSNNTNNKFNGKIKQQSLTTSLLVQKKEQNKSQTNQNNAIQETTNCNTTNNIPNILIDNKSLNINRNSSSTCSSNTTSTISNNSTNNKSNKINITYKRSRNNRKFNRNKTKENNSQNYHNRIVSHSKDNSIIKQSNSIANDSLTNLLSNNINNHCKNIKSNSNQSIIIEDNIMKNLNDIKKPTQINTSIDIQTDNSISTILDKNWVMEDYVKDKAIISSLTNKSKSVDSLSNINMEIHNQTVKTVLNDWNDKNGALNQGGNDNGVILNKSSSLDIENCLQSITGTVSRVDTFENSDQQNRFIPISNDHSSLWHDKYNSRSHHENCSNSSYNNNHSVPVPWDLNSWSSIDNSPQRQQCISSSDHEYPLNYSEPKRYDYNRMLYRNDHSQNNNYYQASLHYSKIQYSHYPSSPQQMYFCQSQYIDNYKIEENFPLDLGHMQNIYEQRMKSSINQEPSYHAGGPFKSRQILKFGENSPNSNFRPHNFQTILEHINMLANRKSNLQFENRKSNNDDENKENQNTITINSTNKNIIFNNKSESENTSCTNNYISTNADSNNGYNISSNKNSQSFCIEEKLNDKTNKLASDNKDESYKNNIDGKCKSLQEHISESNTKGCKSNLCDSDFRTNLYSNNNIEYNINNNNYTSKKCKILCETKNDNESFDPNNVTNDLSHIDDSSPSSASSVSDLINYNNYNVNNPIEQRFHTMNDNRYMDYYTYRKRSPSPDSELFSSALSSPKFIRSNNVFDYRHQISFHDLYMRGKDVFNPNCHFHRSSPSDKFLARANSIQIAETPKNLLNGTCWDNLSQTIWNQFVNFQQKKKTFINKMMLWRYLYFLIREKFARFGVYMVGSTITGFGLDSSDVDICVTMRLQSTFDVRTTAIYHMRPLMDLLHQTQLFASCEIIRAKVPILRCIDRTYNIQIDLNFNNSVGIKNTHLLLCYSQLDWRVRPLVLIVKLWAQSHGINDARNKTISSYSLTLMVIHFLQYAVEPNILPCLQEQYPNKFPLLLQADDFHYVNMTESIGSHECRNMQSLGELFVQFLYYYSRFDYAKYAISVRTGSVLPIEQCKEAQSFQNDPLQWNCLCIEEPFVLSNTAQAVYDSFIFENIKSVFTTSAKVIEITKNLNAIIGEKPININ